MAVLVVGLTGTFGSGKSTVGQLLKQLGAQRVIDCDRLVDEALRTNERIRASVGKLFGFKGRIDRKAISQEVFRNVRKRKQLEAILHPYVFKEIDFLRKEVSKGIVILEVPLLFETGFHRTCDRTIVVTAGKRRIIDRLSRLGFKPSEIEARIRAQWPEHRKKRSADLWISNVGTKKNLAPKVKAVWEKLLSKSNQ